MSAGRVRSNLAWRCILLRKQYEVLSKVLGPVLGPLSDYSNFQDSLLGFSELLGSDGTNGVGDR